MFELITFIPIFVVLILACIEDVRTKEVSLRLQVALFVQCVAHLILNIIFGYYIGIVTFFGMLGVTYILYKLTDFGGADAKIISSLAMVIPHDIYVVLYSCLLLSVIMYFRKRWNLVAKNYTVPLLPAITASYTIVIVFKLMEVVIGLRAHGSGLGV